MSELWRAVVIVTTRRTELGKHYLYHNAKCKPGVCHEKCKACCPPDHCGPKCKADRELPVTFRQPVGWLKGPEQGARARALMVCRKMFRNCSFQLLKIERHSEAEAYVAKWHPHPTTPPEKSP